MKKNIL